MPEIPDFTQARWQSKRTDAQLTASILEGKGKEMPPWAGKVSEGQARSLVAHVRSFAPSAGKAKSGSGQQKGAAPAEFDKRIHRLEKQFDELDSEYHKLTDESPRGASSKRSESRQREDAHGRSAAGAPASRELFGKLCAKCHGKDGAGGPGRDRVPEIPDFTQARWQSKRTDAQLTASILEGKGKEMPPWAGKVSEGQARSLVAHVRSFATAAKKSGSGEQKGSAQADRAGAEAPRGLAGKFIRWLGNFHPLAVHFPIALLTAAAVAELLRMASGRQPLEAVTRYCVWFGTVTAVLAGLLGWFLAGFRLTDASWVLMTHRWLGTSTVACAALVLALREASRHPDRHRTRICFRVILLGEMLLVSLTGFFGGAVVYGLDHYDWPK